MRALLIAVIALSACTVNIVDKRLTREEVSAAFKERDAAIEKIIFEIKKIRK